MMMITAVVRLPGLRGGPPENKTIEIVRRKGGTEPSDVNTYRVWCGNETAEFTHTYGDGWKQCIVRALEALR